MSDNATVYRALKDVVDPEVGLNIVDLGLVYRVEIEQGAIAVLMTMTSPACPFGQSLAERAEAAVRRAFPAVDNVSVTLTHDPPWNPAMMSVEGKRILGIP